jgi:hypothetical protein
VTRSCRRLLVADVAHRSGLGRSQAGMAVQEYGGLPAQGVGMDEQPPAIPPAPGSNGRGPDRSSRPPSVHRPPHRTGRAQGQHGHLRPAGKQAGPAASTRSSTAGSRKISWSKMRRTQPPNPLARVSTEELLMELRRRIIAAQQAREVWKTGAAFPPRRLARRRLAGSGVGSTRVDRFQSLRSV